MPSEPPNRRHALKSIDPQLDIIDILRALNEREVAYVLIGGGAAVLQGAPMVTSDLDIVYQRSADNIERLLVALNMLDAVYRDPLERRLRPTADKLAGRGHHLLVTKAGALNVLAFAGNGHEFDELNQRAINVTDEALVVRVADLAMLIELKKETGRAKDLAALPLLEATLAEKNRA